MKLIQIEGVSSVRQALRNFCRIRYTDHAVISDELLSYDLSNRVQMSEENIRDILRVVNFGEESRCGLPLRVRLRPESFHGLEDLP